MVRIHVKKTKKGFKFRLWDSVQDCYISKELNEGKAREALLQARLEREIELQKIIIDKDIEVAKKQGTSERGATHSLKRWGFS